MSMTTGLLARQRAEQRPLDEEAPAEERGVGAGDAIGRLGERCGAGGLRADRLAEQLRVEHLLGVVPLVERLGLVEPLVALQADEARARAPRRARAPGRSCPPRRAPRRAAAARARARARRRARAGRRRGSRRRELLLEARHRASVGGAGIEHGAGSTYGSIRPIRSRAGKWVSWDERWPTAPISASTPPGRCTPSAATRARSCARGRASGACWRRPAERDARRARRATAARPLRLAGEVRTPGRALRRRRDDRPGRLERGARASSRTEASAASIYFDRGNVVGRVDQRRGRAARRDPLALRRHHARASSTRSSSAAEKTRQARRRGGASSSSSSSPRSSSR